MEAHFKPLFASYPLVKASHIKLKVKSREWVFSVHHEATVEGNGTTGEQRIGIENSSFHEGQGPEIGTEPVARIRAGDLSGAGRSGPRPALEAPGLF